MTQRNSSLPTVNGRRNSSFSEVDSRSSQKQRHYATEFLWKNPSLKFPRTPEQLERRKKHLDEERSFLGYDISTPEMSKATKRNRAIDISEFVRSYVHIRESQLPLLKPPMQCSLVKRDNGSLNYLLTKKKPKEISLPPLEFTEEVISNRGDPCLSSYFSTDMKKLYKLKGLSISKQRKKDRSEAKRVSPKEHRLCLPSKTSKDELNFPSKSKYSWRKELEETNIDRQAGKSSHLWEKYVLGLISKQTAQWIANQCSTGEQRGRLISFLDEKYEIEDVEKDGTATVYKILSINDDAVSPPRRDKQTMAESENIVCL